MPFSRRRPLSLRGRNLPTVINHESDHMILVRLQVSEIASLGVYWGFLILCRPYDDTIFQSYEIITSSGQLGMLIVVIIGFEGGMEAPEGLFIFLLALILMGQIGAQVRLG